MDHSNPAPAKTPAEAQRVLVLQGGGALGSYQAGAYQALCHFDFEPEWIAGISIGAINAAIIAGNPREKRVGRLKQFWEMVSAPVPWNPVTKSDRGRSLFNETSAALIATFGVPGFFTPRIPPAPLWPQGSPQAQSYYDTSPLKKTLERLVDFDRINDLKCRLSVGAVGIITERSDGLLARLWVVPVHRASGLLARINAEAVRVVINSFFLLCVGLLLGLRFEQGVLASLAWLCVPVVFGVAFASLVLTVALYWPSTTLVDAIVTLNSLVLFFCTGFVPLDQYPQWIQPVVEHQPLSSAIEAMRGLSLGGPVLGPALGTLLWSGGIAVACVIPMVLGYRRASMRG